MDKTVFITYSWDSQTHKDWVRQLADKLINNGIHVLLDQYDIQPGESFTHFMEKAISNSEKVLVILSPNYKEKSEERKGGVGYEQQIISGEIMSGIERKKFIPILRSGEYEKGPDCAIPSHFMGISTLDFRREDMDTDSLDTLLRTIYEDPKLVKPPVGQRPSFQTTTSTQSFVIELDQDFNCKLPRAKMMDILLQLSDLRNSGTVYDIQFNIDGISVEYQEYLSLADAEDLTEEKVERKILLREYLNQVYHFENGNIYDYLAYAMNLIIDYSFAKFKSISNYEELYLSVVSCFRLFKTTYGLGSGTTKFDVFHHSTSWSVGIWIPEEDVNTLLKNLGVQDKMILTAHFGLDVFDLSRSTQIEILIPKLAHQFTLDVHYNGMDNGKANDYFQLADFKIGLG